MAQPDIVRGAPLRSRTSDHRWSLQIVLWCALSALGVRAVAHAANCVYTSSQLAVSTIAPNGVLLVKTLCSGEGAECTKAPALEVERGGVAVKGALEVVHQTRDALWVAFRPSAPWQVGQYTVRNLPRSWEQQTDTFEVKATPAAFAFDAAAVKLSLAPGLSPAGERICCPSHGEGSCELSCGGADGERHVAVVRAVFPEAPASVVWRVVDAEDTDAQPTFDSVFNFENARDRYCVKVSAWDVYDDTTHVFERCVAASEAELGEVGRVDTDWSTMHLETCSAPPIVGGYGFDVWGEPRADALPAVEEPLRKAFCASQRKACGLPAQHAPDAGFGSRCSYSPSECPCIFALHYCPEFASEASEQGSDAPTADRTTRSGDADDGCSLSDGRGHASSIIWTLIALAWSARRRGRAR